MKKMYDCVYLSDYSVLATNIVQARSLLDCIVCEFDKTCNGPKVLVEKKKKA